jgi:riboflavin synthase
VFTGIVTERGRVVALDGGSDGLRLSIEAGEAAGRARPGDSISIDGCCLTVTQAVNGRVAFDAMPESLQRSTLGSLAEGDSLTITAVRDGAFEVALVQYTLEQTTLGRLEQGDEVNLEVDLLAKYVEKLIDRDTISGG